MFAFINILEQGEVWSGNPLVFPVTQKRRAIRAHVVYIIDYVTLFTWKDHSCFVRSLPIRISPEKEIQNRLR